jgi:hypothetical protein
MPLQPKKRSSTKEPSDNLGMTVVGAIAILSLVKETTDVFPPLKSAAAIVLGILDSVKVSQPFLQSNISTNLLQTFRSNKEDWESFGDLVVRRIAFLADRLSGNHSTLNSSLKKDLEELSE